MVRHSQLFYYNYTYHSGSLFHQERKAWAPAPYSTLTDIGTEPSVGREKYVKIARDI